MKVSISLKSPANKEGNKLVSIKIFHRGKAVKISTGKQVPAKQWDSKKKELKRGASGRQNMNVFLREAVEQTYDIITEIQNTKGVCTLEDIKYAVREHFTNIYGKESPKGGLDKAIIDYIQYVEQNLGKSTLKTKKTSFKHLNKFLDNSNYTPEFDSINTRFMDRFRGFLMDEGMQNNTCIKYLTCLRTFFTWAEKRDYTSPIIYHLDNLKEDEVEVITLSWEEVMQLYNLDLSDNPRLDKARDIFLFECFTGQRYNDIKTLKYVDIHNGIWRNRQEKGNKIVAVPLDKYASEIINKYMHDSKTDEDYALPILSNQKANEYLKEVGDISVFSRKVTKTRTYKDGKKTTTYMLSELLTTHLGRKTFITTQLAKNTMSVQMIMAISGHKDYKTFKRYIGFTDEQLKEAINREPLNTPN